jgi:hypothetical protein
VSHVQTVTISISRDAKKTLDEIREERPADVSYRVLVEELLAEYGADIGEDIQFSGKSD